MIAKIKNKLNSNSRRPLHLNFISIVLIVIIISNVLTGCMVKTRENSMDTNEESNSDKSLNTKAENLNTNKDADRGINFDLAKIDRSLISGNEKFALDIFKLLNQEDKSQSIFISPFSISSALSMIYNGAAANTKEAMAKALRYKEIHIEKLNESYKNLFGYLNNVDSKVDLDINNSIWFRQGEKLNNDFLDISKDSFNASINEIDFNEDKAADTINSWVNDSTKGKINKIIEGPIPSDVIMYLINAIYFKGQWTTQFNKKNTFEGIFNTESGKKRKVQMMTRSGTVEYGEVDKAKIAKLPYGDKKIAMYFILPDNSININDYISNLDSKRWIMLKESILERRNIKLEIPKFKLEYGIKSLNSSLATLGMKEAFNINDADFSKIRNDIFISNVLHKAIIEINEEGSEAAAVTSVEVTTTSYTEPISFIADRPFIFIIADEETGTILFIGKLSEL